jgi:hypothetical protein
LGKPKPFLLPLVFGHNFLYVGNFTVLKDEDGKDKIAALRLYAEVRGFLKKDEGVTVNNVTNKVLVVNSAGADDDWERKVQRQQLRLIQGAQGA